MRFRIPFVNEFTDFLKIFWKISKWRLPVFVFFSVMTGFTEGIGITLFIPLLSQTSATSAEESILTQMLDKVFEVFNLPMTVNFILRFMAVVFLLAGIFKMAQNVFRVYIKSFVSKKWREKLIGLCGGMEYRYFLDSSTGFFTNAIVTETQRAVAAFSQFCMVISYLISIAIYAVLISLLSWQVILGSIIIGLVFLPVLKFTFKKVRLFSNRTSRQNSVLQEYLIQTIQYFKYLKATARFKKMYDKVVETVTRLFWLEIKQGFVRWFLRVFLEVGAIWAVLAIIWYEVVKNGKDMGAMLMLIIVLYRMVQRMNLFYTSWTGFGAMIGGVSTVSSVCQRLSEHKERTGSRELDGFQDSIEVRDLNFSYGEKQVLFDVNLKIKKNTTVAFVGESGAGKSTLIDLLTGILKPTSGSICVDGLDYNDLNINSLRSIIGYVTQEIVIFNDTISNNVSLWSYEEGDEKKVRDSIQKAYCGDFVMETPQQYDTHIGDRGIKLSVGQRQRLAIAREVFKGPQILMFDEATSALDSKSERYIQESINSFQHEKTILLIAHRLSTVRNSDYIYVLDKGRIAEEGSFSDLYNRSNSRFRRMCDMQSF